MPWVVWPHPDVQHVGVDEAAAWLDVLGAACHGAVEVACRAMPEQFGWRGRAPVVQLVPYRAEC